MTTIAYTNDVLAADSQFSEEAYLAKGPCAKIYKVDPGRFRATLGTDVCLVGLAQGYFSGLLFLDWLQGKLDSEDFHGILQEEDDFLALFVTNKSEIFLCNRYLVLEKINSSFWAIGSGSKIAMAVMDAGGSAEEAVKQACKYDLYTGGDVKTLSLR